MTAQGNSQTPSKPRARDLGIPFDGTPGPLNTITDIKGIEVGHITLISGEGKLQVGVGPVRTGVTAIHPRGRSSNDPVFAGWFSLNGNGSGDIFMAFSTANPNAAQSSELAQLTMLPNDRMNPLFEATVQVVEEAIINAMVAGETMVGLDGHKVIALPHDGVREVLKKYNRLIEPKK